jgi:subtilisin family serine protease
VAATDDHDRLASFSNFGAKTVDLGAPGVSILSTLPGDRYVSYSGTSMATPHVTGAAALIESSRPELDDAQLKAQILQYVDKQPSLEGETVTGGRLNLVRALTQDADVTKPVVAPVRPKPDSRTQDRTPAIIATARDEPTGLTKDDLRFYLDGVTRRTVSYDESTDRLSYTSGKLSYARHTGKVVARDAAGTVTVQRWRFHVVR